MAEIALSIVIIAVARRERLLRGHLMVFAEFLHTLGNETDILRIGHIVERPLKKAPILRFLAFLAVLLELVDIGFLCCCEGLPHVAFL